MSTIGRRTARKNDLKDSEGQHADPS